jgi:hypothetical protein
VIWMSLIFLAYGLMIYINPAYKKHQSFLYCWNFNDWSIHDKYGQFVPSWDSNITVWWCHKTFLWNNIWLKAGLMSFLCDFGNFKHLSLFWMECISHKPGLRLIIWVNIPVLLFAGSYNKKNWFRKSPFMNYQGTGATQWIVGLPLMLIPTLILWYL